MKAGLNEIADLFVVNKADRDGADRIKAELELSVHLRPAGGWRPPVVLTQAATDIGIDGLVAAIQRHRDYQREHRDAAREGERRIHEFAEVLTSEITDRAASALRGGATKTRNAVEQVRSGKMNPYSAARSMLEDRSATAELLGHES
jgi:LAO/AO transport system kinase